VLEAMKMENEILAPGAGRVKGIYVNPVRPWKKESYYYFSNDEHRCTPAGRIITVALLAFCASARASGGFRFGPIARSMSMAEPRSNDRDPTAMCANPSLLIP